MGSKAIKQELNKSNSQKIYNRLKIGIKFASSFSMNKNALTKGGVVRDSEQLDASLSQNARFACANDGDDCDQFIGRSYWFGGGRIELDEPDYVWDWG